MPAELFTAFPTVLPNRGATLPGHHRVGLNSQLRLAVLEQALSDEAGQSLSSFVLVRAPWLNLLRQLGCHFGPVRGEVARTFGRHTEEQFVYLLRPQFAAAAERLRQLLAQA